MTPVCEVCGKATETAKFCRGCGASVGDCCRYKPFTRAWAATKAASKRVSELYSALMGGA